jgi:hypothetical protein
METILEVDEERTDSIESEVTEVLNMITLLIEEIEPIEPIETIETKDETVEPVETETKDEIVEPVETVETKDEIVEPVETVETKDEIVEPVETVESIETVTVEPVEPIETVTVEPVETVTVETTETIETTCGFGSTFSKVEKVEAANELLRINKFPNNKLIFVYSAPKVGSTSIVSSMRLFGAHCFSIIHIHDEEMLYVLSNIKGITINEIILYNRQLGKDVYVIDVFRSPIERKISNYFEKIGAYHFNNTDEKVNTYNVTKVINRFNRIFPHLANGDHFMDKYNINLPEQFDFINKYLYIQQNGIKYIKLRLKDSDCWGPILTSIFGIRICIVKDYETANKPIKDIYANFKANYCIPKNLLDDIMQCKYLNYYYSREELDEYYNYWTKRSGPNVSPFTASDYLLYNELTIENSHIDFIQSEHYMDDGCVCQACGLKRAEIGSKIMRGIPITEKVKHEDAKQELIHKQAARINRVNYIIRQLPPTQFQGKKKRKDFKGDMNLIVNGRR